MAEQNIEAKLKNLLKQEKVQLWSPPYTDDDDQPGQMHMQVSLTREQKLCSFYCEIKKNNLFVFFCSNILFLCLQELAQRYAPVLHLSVTELGGALESIRVQAVKRGKRNKMFRETSVATLELLLPRDSRKVGLHDFSFMLQRGSADVL